jgi:dihydrofolate reductase
LHAHGLIDEYLLFNEPVVVGTGKRLFEPGAASTAPRLVETKSIGKGTVLAIYQPTGKPSYDEFQMERRAERLSPVLSSWASARSASSSRRTEIA